MASRTQSRIPVSVQAPSTKWSWSDETRIGIEVDKADELVVIGRLEAHNIDVRRVHRSATYVVLGAYLGREVRTRHDAVAWLNACGFDAASIC